MLHTTNQLDREVTGPCPCRSGAILHPGRARSNKRPPCRQTHSAICSRLSPNAVGRGSTRHQQTAVTMLARCRCRESRTCSSIDRRPSQPDAASPATPSGRAFGCVRLVVQANQATLEPATDCIQPHVHVSTCCGSCCRCFVPCLHFM